MADEKKPAAPIKPAARLAPASESGDPAVHRLLAEMAVARSNGDDAVVAAATRKLADLGFE